MLHVVGADGRAALAGAVLQRAWASAVNQSDRRFAVQFGDQQFVNRRLPSVE